MGVKKKKERKKTQKTNKKVVSTEFSSWVTMRSQSPRMNFIRGVVGSKEFPLKNSNEMLKNKKQKSSKILKVVRKILMEK